MTISGVGLGFAEPLEAADPAHLPCAGPLAADDEEPIRVVVVMYRAEGVNEAFLRETFRHAARLWSQYGVELVATPAIQMVTGAHLLQGRVHELRDTGSPPAQGVGPVLAGDRSSSSSTFWQRTLDPTFGQGQEDWAATDACLLLDPDAERDCAIPWIHIVALPRIAQRGSIWEAIARPFAGFTWRSDLDWATDAGSPGDLPLPKDAPSPLPTTVYLAVDELSARKDAPWVLAHEIGHALGLAHTTSPARLMSSVRQSGCIPSVAASERELIRQRHDHAP